MLAGLFERCLKRRGVKATDPYDWERPFISNESLPTTRSLPSNYQVAMPPVLTTATTINQAPTTPNVDTNNQENVEPDNRKELDVRNFMYLVYTPPRRSSRYIRTSSYVHTAQIIVFPCFFLSRHKWITTVYVEETNNAE